MSEFKGTQGKWYKGVTGDVKQSGTKKVIADCFFFSDDIEVEQYNALLISKALEMLIDIKGYLGSDKRAEVEKLIESATNLK